MSFIDQYIFCEVKLLKKELYLKKLYVKVITESTGCAENVERFKWLIFPCTFSDFGRLTIHFSKLIDFICNIS